MSQAGEAEWAALSDKERQQKLFNLKMEERKLREAGKSEEARQLLKSLVDAEQGIAYRRLQNNFKSRTITI